jgi:hypothetical protein
VRPAVPKLSGRKFGSAGRSKKGNSLDWGRGVVSRIPEYWYTGFTTIGSGLTRMIFLVVGCS